MAPTRLTLPHLGACVVGAVLGTGASGRVVAARTSTGAQVALKIVPVAQVAWLQREAEHRMLAGPRHAALDGALAEVEGVPSAVLALPLIDGVSLGRLTTTSSEALARVLSEVAATLAALHAVGARHGDVKPDNVIVDREGHAVLVDFGLSAPFEEPLTGATLAFLPPERRATADQPGGAEADVFALGRTMLVTAERLGLAPLPLAVVAASVDPGLRPRAALLADLEDERPSLDAAYVRVRRAEIVAHAHAGGAPPSGVATRLVGGTVHALAGLAGARASGRPLGPLDPTGRRAVLALARQRAPTAEELRADEDTFLAGGAFVDEALALPEALARLALRPDDPAGLAALARCEPPPALRRDVVRLLRRAGLLDRAKLLAVATDDGALEAEVLRQLGAPTEAWAALERAPSVAGHAVGARLRLDAGDLDGAETALEGAEGADEVRALVHWARGRFAEGLAVLDGAVPSDAEQRARLEAVRGMLLHARGDAAAARSAFVRAADLATALGAHQLAATALGSAAAAAHDEGRLGEAWTFATHAVTRFRRLGRHKDAARALMNRAAIACALGARADAMADAARAESLAEAHGDALTGTYARWIRLECLLLTSEPPEAPPSEPTLDDLAGDDRVLAAAYAVLAGRAPASSLATVGPPEGDKARWTLARARLAAADAGLDAVRDLARLDDRSAPPSTVGPTLARALSLAAAHHEGDVARAMATRLRALVSRVSAQVPASHRASFETLPWVRATLALDARADAVGLGEGQIDMLTALSRGLRDRTSLGELLRQVVDGMVLWLGVERGLLLLRAPGEQLVARVGRGISRDDLTGEQRKLSMTLARRALETLEPVVAVDAEDESSDVSGSIHALRLRSVLAVPLVARGEALGVVYLDDRVRRGAFGPREVAWVRLLSTQAAAAIADARDTLRLRRLARRAERAKGELEKILARTEGDLAVARQELSRHAPVAAGADPRGTRHAYRAIIGDGAAVRTLLHTLDRVVDAADARLPVLVSGESGTGKELVARAIHELGPRRHRSFVAENCGAIPEPLLESTLFGHVRGAFTGADRPRTGLFEIADGGTLLLDEVGEMGPAMQAKLLRVLQDGEVRPVGGERSVKVDVRVVAATHRDLAAMVADGRFREDLYYRLAVLPLRVPPLRERAEDLPALVGHLVARFAGRDVRVTRAALSAMAAAPWPGNIRQLENELRRALVMCDDVLDLQHLSPELQGLAVASAGEGPPTLRDQVDALERRLVREALRRCQNNQTQAAKALGLSRFGLQKMLKRLEVR